MFKQLLMNKKIVIVALVGFLALFVGIIIFVTPNSKKTGKNDSDTQTEQIQGEANSKGDKDKGDTTDKGDDKEGSSTKLEILEPDEIAPEDFSNASGSWGGVSNSNTQTGNQDTNEKKDKIEDEKQNILEDDITWGNIY